MGSQTRKPLTTTCFLSQPLVFYTLFYHLFSLSTSHLAQKKLPEEESFIFQVFLPFKTVAEEEKRQRSNYVSSGWQPVTRGSPLSPLEKKCGISLLKGGEKIVANVIDTLSHMHTWSSHYCVQLTHTLLSFKTSNFRADHGFLFILINLVKYYYAI